MTQEDKQLLFKDLCSRLPYGVKCNVWYGPKSPALNEKGKYTDDILETINPKKGNCTFHNAIGYDFGFFPVEHVKPYLRPMSSMTKEEFDEYEIANDMDTAESAKAIRKNLNREKYISSWYHGVDWLNAHNFDYRGLIPKGLALEAKEGMYNQN